MKINGENSTALVFGGFGFKERQMGKHSSLYSQFGFNVVPVLPSYEMMNSKRAYIILWQWKLKALQCIFAACW